jgi:hypothetical protein
MRTFLKFLSGTTGILVAIGLCIVASCVLCVLSGVAIPIIFPITPTP